MTISVLFELEPKKVGFCQVSRMTPNWYVGPGGARSGELPISQDKVHVVPVIVHQPTIFHQ
jgi:hypothetical protein